jgi:UPF0755 protein
MFRGRVRIIALLVVLALVGGGGWAATHRGELRALSNQLMNRDYSGTGTGVVMLVIHPGDGGATVAQRMVDKGITKDFGVTYQAVIDTGIVFYPGSYKLAKGMSVAAALSAIADPSSLSVNRVTIKEGLRLTTIFDTLSAATGIARADFEAAATHPSVYGLPKNAPSLEGYLFPATYSFDKAATAKSIIRQMVDRMNQELTHFGVKKSKWNSVLTLASIVQKEARQTGDFYKVSRVFKNRITVGMPLQSDATVSYGTNGTTVTTTDAQRADPNAYNTYVHLGLPIGPISAPGSTAIDAALHPISGSWLYFCTVNLQTGETVFSTTIAEHETAVAKFQAWLRQNPGWNG